MNIPLSDWLKFTRTLSALNNKAASELAKYINKQGGLDAVDRDALVGYAYGLVTKYGEGAAAAAAEMYDAIAVLSGASVAPAVPAQTAAFAETAKAINGTMKTGNAEIVVNSAGRLVKMAGVDTTIQNALRDGAEWAWIPNGDTCAFCLMLASNGWQRASKKVLKGGHAEHIHANCDCTFAIRFDKNTNVKGYTPERYKRMYDSAEGSSAKEKLNSMRRDFYALNKNEGLANLNASIAEEINVGSVAKVAARAIPKFTPAKTTQEAEEFARQFVVDGKYGKVSYSGIVIQYANDMNRALNEVLSQYEPKYKLQSIEPMNKRSKAFRDSDADMAYRWSSCDMYFQKAYYKSERDFKKHLAQHRELYDQVMPNIDALIEQYRGATGIARKQLDYVEALKITGRTNVGDISAHDSMVHEIGHYLDDTLFRSEFQNSGFSIKDSYEKYAKKVSAYATESNREYLAESFLAYWKGETDILDPDLVAIFERLRK